MSAWLPVLTTLGGVPVGWAIGRFLGWRALRGRAHGGWIPPIANTQTPAVLLAPGELITDPERAEQLGLTVEARRMRQARNAG